MKRCCWADRVLRLGNPIRRKNGNFGRACAWKPSSAGAVRYAVRRWRRPTGGWTVQPAAEGRRELTQAWEKPWKRKARRRLRRPSARLRPSQPASKMKWRQRPRQTGRLSKRSEGHPQHPPRPPFLQPQPIPPRHGMTLPRRGSPGRKIPPVGSASMKARFWKRSWSHSSPATFRARSWRWSPSRSIRRTGSASWCREERGLLARPGPWRTRTNRAWP